MRSFSVIILLLTLPVLQSCFLYGKKEKLSIVSTHIGKKVLNSTLTSVNVANDVMTINGSGFSGVNAVKIKSGGSDEDLVVESSSDTQVIVRASSALSLLAEGTLDLIISTADAQATYPITFTLQDGAVTASKLASMNATSGQILKFDGTNWGPADLTSSQTYVGTWNASTQTPDLAATTPNSGDYYVVSVAGDYTVPNPDVHFDVGDWIMYNGTSWEKVASGLGSKLGLNGGTLTGDLVLDTLMKFKGGSNYVTLKGSSSLASDIVLTLPISVGANGQALTTNGSGVLSWSTITAGGAAGGDLTGTYPNPTITGLDATKIANGSVTNAQFQYLSGVTSNIQTQLSAKQDNGTFITGLTGDVTATGPGAAAATVAQVGGVTAANVAAAAVLANASTNLNTASTVVKRDASGNFTAGTITGTLNGNATNVTGTVAVANGGTGSTSLGLNQLLFGNGASAIGGLATTSTPSVLLSAVTTGAPTWTTSTSGNFLKAVTGSGVEFGPILSSDLPSGTLSGSGTVNYVPYYSAVSTLANSPMAVSGNNVGIGTTSPTAAKLVVTDGVTTPVNSAVLASSALISAQANGAAYIFARDNTNSIEYLAGTSISGFAFMGSATNHAFSLRTANTDRLYITNSGLVGIGTTSPTAASLQISTAAAASLSGQKIDGAWYSGGTATTTKPMLLVEPSTATSTNWSTTGTGLGVNSASGFTGNLLDLQLNGSSKLKVTSGGYVYTTGNISSGYNGSVAYASTSASYTYPLGSGGSIGATNYGAIDGYFSNLGLSTKNTAGNQQNFNILAISNTGAGAYTPSVAFTMSNGATSYSEVMRINSSGYLGIGTTGPSYKLDVNGTARVSSTLSLGPYAEGSISNGSLNLYNYEAPGSNASASVINLKYAHTDASVASGDSIGKINFNASTPTWGQTTSSQIAGQADGAVTASSSPGRLVFKTAPPGTVIVTERMRIDSVGNVGIGTTSPSTKLHVEGSTGATIATFSDGGGTTCTVTPATTGFACSSDKRLKKNIESFPDLDSLDKILKLRTVTYDWRNIDNGRHTGYVAQEIEEVAPELVRTDVDGYKQVSYSGFIPWITGAIKAFYGEFKSIVTKVMLIENKSAANERLIASIKLESNEIRAENQKLRKENDDIKSRLQRVERILERIGGTQK